MKIIHLLLLTFSIRCVIMFMNEQKGEMYMRKLVTIQEVAEVLPIEKADRIETVRILGWYVVVRKGQFKVGDKVVYAEVDSLFPDKEEFQFLKAIGSRVRTVRLRGQVSQGLCFPLDILPEGDYEVGDEVTELLGVTKYEPPIPAVLEGEAKGVFPGFLEKSDETRVQLLQDRLTKFKGVRTVITEKLDGTSSTFYLNRDEFGVCSRGLELLEDDKNTYWQMAHKYDIESKLRKLGRNIALQGETIGANIQKNKYRFEDSERDLRLFNIYDIDKSEYVDFLEFTELAKQLGIPTVPVIDDNFVLIDNIDELVEMSKGRSGLNNKVHREGIVIKGYEEVRDMGERLSFKVINPDFLIKYDE